MAGKSMDFQQLIKMYEQMAEIVDEQNQYQQEDMVDEFLAPLESDPSKAELMCICQTLTKLYISLKYKRDELVQAEADLANFI